MLINYIKTAFKVLARRKFFTFITLFAITFTLVVLIVASSLLDFTFAPQKPETRLDRTVGVFVMAMASDDVTQNAFGGYRTLNEHLRGLPGAERVSLVRMATQVSSYVNGGKVTSWLKQTDGEFWRIYDFDFIEGGPFSSVDEAKANRVAVINRATRDHFFGGVPALGQTITLDGQTFRVVGVVENVPATRLVPFGDVWTPISTAIASSYRNEYVGDFFGMVVARDKRQIPEMEKEFKRRLDAIKPVDTFAKRVTGGLETEFEAVSRLLFSGRMPDQNHPNALRFTLLTIMFLFMTIPAVNLMNISVSRTMERSGEIGVRKAFGASSWTLVGQFVTENVIVTLLGGLISLVAAELVLTVLNHSSLILYGNFHLNWRIFLYGMAISLVFGLVTSLYPAWRMSRLHPVEALRGRHA